MRIKLAQTSDFSYLFKNKQWPKVNDILATIVVTMGVGLVAIYFPGRSFKLRRKLTMLLGVGTTICGGSAITVMAPIIDANEEESSYAITTLH